MATRYRRPGGLAVLAAAAAIGLAACSTGSSTPHVASLGTSGANNGGSSGGDPAGNGNGGGSSAAPGSKGNATKLVDDWAACMRSHGDPSQSDPVINSVGDIEISMTNVSAAMSSQAHDSSGPCGHYLTAATSALRDGQPLPEGPDQAKLLKYAQCMQANGVPKYPDPVPGATEVNLRNIGMSLSSPVFVKANDLCSKKTGMPAYFTGPPPAGVVQVSSCNAPSGVQCHPPGGPGGGAPNRPRPGNGSGGNG
jgi:hypothetical protein